jgi:hypothetical protein
MTENHSEREREREREREETNILFQFWENPKANN